MIKAILFDFVQTLGNAAEGYKEAEKISQKELFETAGITEWDEFIEVYRKVRKENFEKADLSRAKMWSETLAFFNIEPAAGLLEKMEDNYWNIVKKSMKLFPEALEVLEKLKKNYKTGLITNSQKDGSTKALDSMEFEKLQKLMDVIVVAAEGDIPAKPALKPFQIALEKLSVRPEEAVFVGDDWRVDIEGSRNAGMIPVWLKHESVKRNWPEPVFDVIEIKTLLELINIENMSSENRQQKTKKIKNT